MKTLEGWHPTVLDMVECGMVKPWPQRTPRVDGALTFASSRYEHVLGKTAVHYITAGLMFSYKVDAGQDPFTGIHPLYERPPFEVSPFDGIVVSDAEPELLYLTHNDMRVPCPIPERAMRVAVELARVNFVEKFQRVLETSYPEVAYLVS